MTYRTAALEAPEAALTAVDLTKAAYLGSDSDSELSDIQVEVHRLEPDTDDQQDVNEDQGSQSQSGSSICDSQSQLDTESANSDSDGSTSDESVEAKPEGKVKAKTKGSRTSSRCKYLGSDDELPSDDSEYKPGKRLRLTPKPKKTKKHVQATAKLGDGDTHVQNTTKKAPEKGFLWKFNELPLDVICEIFSLLEPIDLLHIGRSNKQWRRMIFSSRHAIIWKQAFSNLPGDFPPCPDDLDLPELASLVFDHHCMVCHKNGTNLEYVLRVRTCGKCAKNTIFNPRRHACVTWDLHPDVLRLLPCDTAGWGKKRRYFFLLDVRWMDAKLKELELATRGGKSEKGTKAFHKFVDAHAALAESIMDHASDVTSWRIRAAARQKQIAEQFKVQNRTFIRNRLVELGYDASELAGDWLADAFRTGDRPPLTFYDWDAFWKSSKDDFERALASHRKKEVEVLQRPRRDGLYQLYRNWRHGQTDTPDKQAFVHLPIVMSTVKPGGPTIDEELWNDILPSLQEDIAAWRITRLKALLALAQQGTCSYDARMQELPDDQEELRERFNAFAWGFRQSGGGPLAPEDAYNLSAALDPRSMCNQELVHGAEVALCDKARSTIRQKFVFHIGQNTLLSQLADNLGKRVVAAALQGSGLMDDDRSELRFLCPSCPERPRRRLRNMLAHLVFKHPPDAVMRSVSVESLTTAALSQVAVDEETEQRRLRDERRADTMTCDICLIQFYSTNNSYWYEHNRPADVQLERHIRESHDITHPQSEDMLYGPCPPSRRNTHQVA